VHLKKKKKRHVRRAYQELKKKKESLGGCAVREWQKTSMPQQNPEFRRTNEA